MSSAALNPFRPAVASLLLLVLLLVSLTHNFFLRAVVCHRIVWIFLPSVLLLQIRNLIFPLNVSGSVWLPSMSTVLILVLVKFFMFYGLSRAQSLTGLQGCRPYTLAAARQIRINLLHYQLLSTVQLPFVPFRFFRELWPAFLICNFDCTPYLVFS